MKFTIVTPVLNGARFLEEALRSIQGQSYQNWEHLIVDGGSQDGSLEIAREWAWNDDRIKALPLPGKGMYEAIFHGIARATGETLSWLNCDDLYAPWALSTVADFLERTDAAWVTGLPGAWDAKGRLRVVRPALHLPRAWIRRGWCHEHFLGCLQQESMFFRRTLIERLTVEERKAVCSMKLAGDFLLWRKLAQHAELRVIPTALAGFRVHEANMSARRRDEYLGEVKGSGAPFPPALLSRLAAFLVRLYSTYMLQRTIADEDVTMKLQARAERTTY